MIILTIARLTLRETSRKRLLIALAILTVIVALLSGWGFHRLVGMPCGNGQACTPAETKVLASTLIVLMMFMFSFVVALAAAFVSSPAIAGDVESGVVLSVVSRPIRRSDVVLGKWLGLASLVAFYTAFTCAMEFIIGKISFGYVPPHPILAILFLTGEALAVLSVSLAWSTRLPAMTGGIIVLILFGISWMLGVVGNVGHALQVSSVERVSTAASLIFPTDGLWRGAIYNLEPVSLIITQQGSRSLRADPFFAPSPAPTAYVIFAAAWILAFLAIAAWSFQRREL